MEEIYLSRFLFKPSVSPQGQLSIQSQTQHAKRVLAVSTDSVTAAVQGYYQPQKMMTQIDELLVQAGRADNATKSSMILSPWVVPQGIVAGVQGPSHVANVTSPTVVPEDLMGDVVSPSWVYSTLGDDTSTGSVADTNTLGLQASSPPALPTQPHFNMVDVFTPGAQQLATIGSGICQRQQLIPCEYAQAPIADGFVLGANQATDPITLTASGGIVGDGWTGTLRWQREREGAWSQVQAVATDGVRNPMFSIWPSLLHIQFPETVRAISSLDIQTWLLKTKAPVARIKGRPEDSHQFGDLVKLVRSGGSYALAGWERGQPQFLLVPLNEDLLCTFSPSGIASLPEPQLRQPVRKKRRVPSSCRVRSQPGSRPKAVGIHARKQRPYLKTVQSAPTQQPTEPHRQAQLRARRYTGDSSMPQPKVQQTQRVASLNMLGSGGMDDSWTDPVATGGVANSSYGDGLGSTLPMDGNGGPWFRVGEGEATHSDTDIAVLDYADTTHIPVAILEANEDFDFDMGKYVDWEVTETAAGIGPRYH